MTIYGMLVVDPNWANHDSVEIGKATLLHHKDRLVPGTRVLIYIDAPVQAVVAEAEITGGIHETEADAPPMRGAKQTVTGTYSVPLKLLRLKGQIAPITLNQLHMILGSGFSVFGETWLPLRADQYEAVTADWHKEKTP